MKRKTKKRSAPLTQAELKKIAAGAARLAHTFQQAEGAVADALLDRGVTPGELTELRRNF